MGTVTQAPPSHWAQWLGGDDNRMIPKSSKIIEFHIGDSKRQIFFFLSWWCMGTVTHAPPSHWAQRLGGEWVKVWFHSWWCMGTVTHTPPAVKPCPYPFTTEPLSSAAWWCMGNATHAPPSQKIFLHIYIFLDRRLSTKNFLLGRNISWRCWTRTSLQTPPVPWSRLKPPVHPWKLDLEMLPIPGGCRNTTPSKKVLRWRWILRSLTRGKARRRCWKHWTGDLGSRAKTKTNMKLTKLGMASYLGKSHCETGVPRLY